MPTTRRGYALLMCLLVVGVSSSVVLTLFNIVRLQTAEATARRQLVVNQSLANGAFEHALAILLDQPTFTGTFNVVLPVVAGQSYSVDIQQSGANVIISANLQAGGVVSFMSRTIALADLQQRRINLGLQ